MNKHRTFGSASQARKYADALAVAEGYPKDGQDVGGGRHAPRAQTRTVRYSEVTKHPTKNSWAVVVGAEVEKHHNTTVKVDGEDYTITTHTAEKLPADWKSVAVIA